MKETQYWIQNGQISLFARRWDDPDRPPRAILLLVHGFAEHSGRYTHVVTSLVEAGFRVEALDYRGHGRSEGARAFVRSFDVLLTDIQIWAQRVDMSLDDSPPIFALGHSLGALILVLYVLKYRPHWHGIMLSSPALKIAADFSPILQKLAPIIGALLPKLKTTKIDPSLLSYNPEVGKKYLSDPLNYTDGIKAAFGAATLRAMQIVEKDVANFNLPLLILHGADDQLNDPRGSQFFYTRVSSADKEIEIVPNMRHEILNEDRWQLMVEKYIDWMDGRC